MIWNNTLLALILAPTCATNTLQISTATGITSSLTLALERDVALGLYTILFILASAFGALFVSAVASTLLRVRVPYLSGFKVCLCANIALVLGFIILNAFVKSANTDPSKSTSIILIVLWMGIWFAAGAYSSGYFIKGKANPMDLRSERIGLKKGTYVWFASLILHAIVYGLLAGFIALLSK